MRATGTVLAIAIIMLLAHTHRLLSISLLWLALSSPVRACKWDSDTLAAEAKGLPEVVQVVTGRFERNPPLYYQLRLQRAAALIEADPCRLEAYDDAGAACDRLGHSDDAIRWMERKRSAMERAALPAATRREHRYRYLANVGTFWAHPWLRGGADRRHIGDVRKARDFIRAAIRLNPNAHFGRERYQLRALEWILDPPAYDPSEAYRTQRLPDFLGLENHHGETSNTGSLKKLGYSDAVQGLAGLIVLGNAWESVDVFHALARALQIEGRSSLAYLAQLRCGELIDAGSGSLLPGAPKGRALKEKVIPLVGYIRGRPALADEYLALRAAANAWHAHRIAFMMARLQAGRHPDSDPQFWQGYSPPPPPRLSNWRPEDRWLLQALACLLMGVGLTGAALHYVRRRKRETKSGGSANIPAAP
jgi:hypothetical protein